MGRVKTDIYKREREFHSANLSDVDVVKGLITLRAQLDIYNDFMQDGGGELGVSNWKNVNQEVVTLFAMLDSLVEKARLMDNQVALVNLVGSGLEVGDVAGLLGVETRKVERSIDKLCRKIVEQNNMEWLRWAYMNYIETEWKTCRVCNEQYPCTNQFFHKNETNDDGLRNECVMCNRHNRVNLYSSVTKMAKSMFPGIIVEGLNNFNSKPKKDKKKTKKKKKPQRNVVKKEMKLMLPDGSKTLLPLDKNIDERKEIVNSIMAKYNNYFEENWDSDRVRTCLDVLGYYLCKTENEQGASNNVLSSYKMREMKDGNKKHTTFSSLSTRQRAALGLLDFDDSCDE